MDDSPPATLFMSPESLPELAALQKVTAQKGSAGYATMIAAQGRAGFNRYIGLFEFIRQRLQ